MNSSFSPSLTPLSGRVIMQPDLLSQKHPFLWVCPGSVLATLCSLCLFLLYLSFHRPLSMGFLSGFYLLFCSEGCKCCTVYTVLSGPLSPFFIRLLLWSRQLDLLSSSEMRKRQYRNEETCSAECRTSARPAAFTFLLHCVPRPSWLSRLSVSKSWVFICSHHPS